MVRGDGLAHGAAVEPAATIDGRRPGSAPGPAARPCRAGSASSASASMPSATTWAPMLSGQVDERLQQAALDRGCGRCCAPARCRTSGSRAPSPPATAGSSSRRPCRRWRCRSPAPSARAGVCGTAGAPPRATRSVISSTTSSCRRPCCVDLPHEAAARRRPGPRARAPRCSGRAWCPAAGDGAPSPRARARHSRSRSSSRPVRSASAKSRSASSNGVRRRGRA